MINKAELKKLHNQATFFLHLNAENQEMTKKELQLLITALYRTLLTKKENVLFGVFEYDAG